MASANHIIFMGNLTRDPETRQVGGGSSVTSFGMAANRRWTDERGEQREAVTFIDVEIWGRGGEVVQKYCRKGSGLLVQGRIDLDQWEDRQSGAKRSRHKITAQQFQFVGGRPDGEGDRGGHQRRDRGAASPQAEQTREEYRRSRQRDAENAPGRGDGRRASGSSFNPENDLGGGDAGGGGGDMTPLMDRFGGGGGEDVPFES